MVIQTLFFESRSNSPNVITDANGDAFTTLFKPPLWIPKGAKNCYVSLISARIINNIDNIKVGINDKFYYKSYVNSVLSAERAITLDSGMYSVSDLNSALDREILAQTGVSGAIKLSVEYATNTIFFTVANGWQIDFSPAKMDTFRALLGFTSSHPESTAGVLISAADNTVFGSNTDSEYGLNSVVHLHSSFGKSNVNGTSSDVLEVISFTVSPGFPQNYQAVNPNLIDASNLAGTEISDAYFRLTNSFGSGLVLPDSWSVTMRLQYDM